MMTVMTHPGTGVVDHNIGTAYQCGQLKLAKPYFIRLCGFFYF